jgi:hypothetical protein
MKQPVLLLLMAVIALLCLSGCTSADLKAQQEKLLNDYNASLANLIAASDNATAFINTFNHDHQEAIKDNSITQEERDNLQSQCSRKPEISSNLKEAIDSFRKYLTEHEAVLIQSGIDVERGKALLTQADNLLSQLEGIASICDQLFGQPATTREQGTTETATETTPKKQIEDPSFLESAQGSCELVGTYPVAGATYPLYEVTASGTVKGPSGTEAIVNMDGGTVSSEFTCKDWPVVSSVTPCSWSDDYSHLIPAGCAPELWMGDATRVCIRHDSPESTEWTLVATFYVEPFSFHSEANYEVSITGAAQTWERYESSFGVENSPAAEPVEYGSKIPCPKMCSKELNLPICGYDKTY